MSNPIDALAVQAAILSMIKERGECTVGAQIVRELAPQQILQPSGIPWGLTTRKQFECWCRAYNLRCEFDIGGNAHLFSMLGPDRLREEEEGE